MSELFSLESLIAFVTLTVLEVVLGIDNIVFIAILSGKLPRERQAAARQAGLAAAMITRIVLLLAITWIMQLDQALFAVLGQDVSGRDLILIAGGLFLLAKATYEIHDKLEAPKPGEGARRAVASFAGVIVQIMLVDLVFSIDSVVTAVGMVPPDKVGIMIAAVVAAVVVMLIFAGPVSGFIERHPTIRMLALSFLLLIGFTLVMEGCGAHVSKGYIYFAMGFSLFVELLNLRMRRLHRPVHLYEVKAPAT